MSDFFETLERQLVEAARERPERLRRARVRRLAAAGAATALLLAGGAAAAVGVGGDGREAAPADHHTSTERPTVTAPPPLTGVRVAVLNGTTTPGLARAMAERLDRAGATIGVVANAATQTETQTRIFFRRGRQQQAARVASVLTPTDANLWQEQRGLFRQAGPRDEVVVLVGEDLLGGRSTP